MLTVWQRVDLVLEEAGVGRQRREPVRAQAGSEGPTKQAGGLRRYWTERLIRVWGCGGAHRVKAGVGRSSEA